MYKTATADKNVTRESLVCSVVHDFNDTLSFYEAIKLVYYAYLLELVKCSRRDNILAIYIDKS